MWRHHFADAALALLLGGVAITVLLATADMPPPRWEPLGAAFLPRVLAIGLLALAGAVVVQSLWRLRSGTDWADGFSAERIPVRRYVDTLVLILATIVAIGGMYLDLIGYRPAIFMLTVLSVEVLSGFSRKTLLPAILLALVLSVGLHFVMTEFLSTRLP